MCVHPYQKARLQAKWLLKERTFHYRVPYYMRTVSKNEVFFEGHLEGKCALKKYIRRHSDPRIYSFQRHRFHHNALRFIRNQKFSVFATVLIGHTYRMGATCTARTPTSGHQITHVKLKYSGGSFAVLAE